MATQKQKKTYEEGVDAAFMENHRGDVCIVFPDPAYVRSDAILVEKSSGAIRAILHESEHLLGYVSDGMINAFAARKEALLTAVRPDGSVFELMAPVQLAKG